MSSVLYDVAGPRAIVRNRVLGVLTVLLVAALLGFVIYRMIVMGQFSADKWEVFSYGAVWRQIAEATGRTLAAFGTAAVLSLITGLALGIARVSDHRWIRLPATAVIELLRAIPVLILMMLLYYGFPEFGVHVPSYWAVVIALTAYNGSVLAEVLRTGVDSVPRGQSEAAYAIGLRKIGVMRLVVLPQAVRAMLPVIIAQLVVTLKDTALGYIITYNELLYYARLIGTQAQYDSPILQAGMVAAVIYIALCLTLAGFAKWVEGRTRRSPRTKVTPAPAEIVDEGA